MVNKDRLRRYCLAELAGVDWEIWAGEVSSLATSPLKWFVVGLRRAVDEVLGVVETLAKWKSDRVEKSPMDDHREVMVTSDR